MAVDIPTPFDLLTTTGFNKGNVGTPITVQVKNNGGVRLSDNGFQWVSDDASISTTDEGIYQTFNTIPESAVDMTGEIFVISWTFNAPNRIQLNTTANRGQGFRLFTTDLNNYIGWNLGGSDSARPQLYGNTHKICVIDPTSTTQFSAGTYNITSTLWYGCTSRRADIAGTSTSWSYISRAVRMGTTKAATNIPRIYGSLVKLKDLHTEVIQTDYLTVNHNYTEKLGTAYFYACPFAIGKAANTTTFDDEGITVISPPSNDTSDPRFHLSTDAMRVYFDLQTGDTADLSGSYNWGTRAPWDIDSAETITFAGASFTGMGTMAMGAGVTGNGNFSSVDVVTLNASGDLDGSNFDTPFGNHLLSIG